ncbi:hypothetical protein GCM10007939_21110 [Amylibacter marinus]|uniref:Ferrochelatase n=1 Tax=Amylibacter marinus TaxID=1475483 RepID=A0ABQ5VWK7_9RHOB|nr:hypothetical protein [Amylibacter marinus]GLQ35828.1 hypothetical protein GCM10007939_21110 [Amylibacter marinus]
MKYVTPIATAAALSVAPVQAGTLTEPAVEEMIEMEDKSSSSTGILVPLLLLGVVAAVIASSDDDDDDNTITTTLPSPSQNDG